MRCRRAAVAAVVVVSVGCGASSSQRDPASELLAAADAKAIAAQWQGAWVMPFRSGDPATSRIGTREVWAVTGNQLTRWDGDAETTEPMTLLAPCLLKVGERRFRYQAFAFADGQLVVDGAIGFTGGLNVGDEYLGRAPDGRLWIDLHLRLTGDAVLGLHAIFLEDWLAATGETLDLDPDDPRIEKTILRELTERPTVRSCGPMVQIIPSGPDLMPGLGIAAQFVAAISTASERCWIATPYFVPDDALNLALKTAALRGVDVRVLVPLPRNNDSRLVSLAARSYYDEFLEAGVRLYEFLPGMLHSKYLLVDRTVAAIGSANMDVRSFYINYEVTAMLYDRGVTDQLAEVFTGYLSRAVEIKREGRRNLPLYQRLGESFARTLSPLL